MAMESEAKILCAKFPEVLQRVIMSFCEANIEYTERLELCGSIHLKADGEKLISIVIDDEVSRPGSENQHEQNWSSGYSSHSARAMSVSSSDMEVSIDNKGSLPPYVRRQSRKRLYNYERPSLYGTEAPTRCLSSPYSNVNSDKSPNADTPSNGNQNKNEVMLLNQNSFTNDENLVPTDLSLSQKADGLIKEEKLLPKVTEDTPNTVHITQNSPSMLIGCGMRLPTVSQPYTFAGPFTSGTVGATDLPLYPNPIATLQAVTNSMPPTPMQIMQQNMQILQQTGMMMPFAPMNNNMLPKPPTPRFKKQPSYVKSKKRLGVGVGAVTAGGIIKPSRRFGCPYCDATFANSQSMKNHINCQHTRSRKYPCTICNKVFYSGGAVYLHLKRNHAGEKAPNTCSVCHKLFVNMTSYVRHVLFAHNLHACGSCGTLFSNTDQLASHKPLCTGKLLAAESALAAATQSDVTQEVDSGQGSQHALEDVSDSPPMTVGDSVQAVVQDGPLES